MSRDDIIRMAREAGFQTGVIHGADGSPIQTLVQHIGHSCIVELERFYALAVAKEREARQQALREALEYAPHPAHYPLTDKEIQDVWCSAKGEANQYGAFWFARAIEKAHGIK